MSSDVEGCDTKASSCELACYLTSGVAVVARFVALLILRLSEMRLKMSSFLSLSHSMTDDSIPF